jgi:hypothetical protein
MKLKINLNQLTVGRGCGAQKAGGLIERDVEFYAGVTGARPGISGQRGTDWRMFGLM